MRKRSTTLRFCFIVLFVAFGFLGGSDARAVNMVVTNLFPANNAVEVCADTKLWITFSTTPTVAADGNLQICRVSNDNVVYQLHLQTLPSDSYGHIASGWPYQINLNGLSVNYEPFAVSGNTVEIYPSVRLDYNTAYYVKMTAGFCTDANGKTSPAITDNTTWRFTTKATQPAADHDYMVALDGSGDYCTLQGATDAVVDNDPCRTLIRVKKGTYRELINIPSSKINVTWLGEDRDTTIIAGYNREAFNGGTANRNVVKNYGNGFRMYNMTLQNTTSDGGGQAETIRNNALKCIAQNCKFKSYQDTLYFGGGQMYFKDSYIEGDTDYIWGGGTVYFDKCEIRSLTTSNSYVTQPRTVNGTNGLFFVDCNMTAPAGVINCYLGRGAGATYPYGQTVYINCTMPSTLFRPVGWLLNNTPPADLRLWEYKSVEPNGTLINVSQRLNPGSKQLNDANAIYWREVNNVFSYNPWNPKEVNEPPTAAWQPHPANGATGVLAGGTSLTWAAGAEAESHIVYFGTTNPPDPNFAIEQTGTSFATGAMTADINYYWQVDEKNSAGTTTGEVWSFITTATPPTPDPMTFATAPYAASDISITMVATTATSPYGVEYYFTCTGGGGHNSGWQDSATYTDTGLYPSTTYTYTVKARDKSTCQNETAASTAASAITLADTTAPTPDPMTFAIAPYSTSPISMDMAATATDVSGVEYYFTCTAGGGHDSIWQDSPTYTDTGLTEGTTYTYTVKARDKSPNQNETMPSDPCSGTTLLDTTAPEPNPMTFNVAPHALDTNSIAMTATTATDISGVEYYFVNITDPNHDSDWQDGTAYTDTGLTNGTTYSYSVIARDKSLGQNETAWSDEANATTLQYICSIAIASDLDENCKVDFMDLALMASHWNDVMPLNNDIAVNGTFDTDIVPGWQMIDLPSAEGTLLVIYDGGNGDPVGSVVMGNELDNGTSGHYFYQILPVDTGKQYKLSAEWMGDIYGNVESDPYNLSNWVQVLVAFGTNADANTWTAWTDPNMIMYSKVFGVANQNIDSSGTWSWEPITASQTNGPADGVFTASGDYMVVAFSEGGLANSGFGYFYADNVKVEGPECSPIDLNSDCYLDWLDIEQFATDWLSCNRYPASECWQ
jgi:pectin methylesterase-like acyl-CoA thioesterase